MGTAAPSLETRIKVSKLLGYLRRTDRVYPFLRQLRREADASIAAPEPLDHGFPPGLTVQHPESPRELT